MTPTRTTSSVRAKIYLLLFGLLAGAAIGVILTVYLVRPDPALQHRHDVQLAAARRNNVERETLTVRTTRMLSRVDTLAGRVDTITRVIREALPDTLRPRFDLLTAANREIRDSLRTAMLAWRTLDSATAAGRNDALDLAGDAIASGKHSAFRAGPVVAYRWSDSTATVRAGLGGRFEAGRWALEGDAYLDRSVEVRARYFIRLRDLL